MGRWQLVQPRQQGVKGLTPRCWPHDPAGPTLASVLPVNRCRCGKQILDTKNYKQSMT